MPGTVAVKVMTAALHLLRKKKERKSQFVAGDVTTLERSQKRGRGGRRRGVGESPAVWETGPLGTGFIHTFIVRTIIAFPRNILIIQERVPW